MYDLMFLLIQPGFIVLLLFGLILVWGVLCTWGLWLKPPLPRYVKILATTQLVTSLLYEAIWIDLMFFCNPLSQHVSQHDPLFSDSVARTIVIASLSSCAIAFLTTMLVAICKPTRSNIRCFLIMVFQSLFYLWSLIALDAPTHC